MPIRDLPRPDSSRCAPTSDDAASNGDADLGGLARELRPSLVDIVETLTRFSREQASGTDTDAASPDLIWKARHLADELAEIVAALERAPVDPVDARSPHTTVLVRHAIARAADASDALLAGRRVVVRCSAQLAITTQANRLHELLVTAIEESARRKASASDVRVAAHRSGTRLVVEVEGGVVAGHGIERLHHLARAVGGRIEVVAGPETRAALRFHIPQARSGDLTDLPDDVA